MIKRTKQDWQIGNIVKVGFVANLEVIKCVPTPGDGRPDVYVLWQSQTGRFYTFQPHFGLTRHADLAEALAA
jgi:hypothetical protein